MPSAYVPRNYRPSHLSYPANYPYHNRATLRVRYLGTSRSPLTSGLPCDFSELIQPSGPIKEPRRKGKRRERKKNSPKEKSLQPPGKFSQPSYPAIKIGVAYGFLPDLLLLQGRSDPIPRLVLPCKGPPLVGGSPQIPMHQGTRP